MIKIIISLLFIFSCFIYANELTPSFAVGVVTYDKSGVLISTTKILLQDDVIVFCSIINKRCESVRGKFIAAPIDEPVEDIATGEHVYTYLIPGNRVLDDIDVAIIYPKNNFSEIKIKFGEVRNLLITVQDIKYDISSCVSSEGVHIYSNQKKIHLYYSLGYDVISNCSDEVYK